MAVTSDLGEHISFEDSGDGVLLLNKITREVLILDENESASFLEAIAAGDFAAGTTLSAKLNTFGAFVSKTMPVANEALASTVVGDELVVYNTRQNTAHCLEGLSVEVFQKCDGKSSVSEVAAKVTDGDEEAVCKVLDSFKSAGLISETYVGPRKVSRRDVMKAAAVLPVMVSMIVPRAAAAASACVIPSCDIKTLNPSRCGDVCPNPNDNTCTWICYDLVYRANSTAQTFFNTNQTCGDPAALAGTFPAPFSGFPYTAFDCTNTISLGCCVQSGQSSQPCSGPVSGAWCCSNAQSGGLCT